MSSDKPIVLYGRTRSQFEQAVQNANCPLFEAICRWVVQDEGYVSLGALVNRIDELERIEQQSGIQPIRDFKKYQHDNGF